MGKMSSTMRYDSLTRFRADYTGGISRLLAHGAVFTNTNLEHYPTVTAVGHATMLSGATPSVSGIIGNDWFERGNRRDRHQRVRSGRQAARRFDRFAGVAAAASGDDDRRRTEDSSRAGSISQTSLRVSLGCP
jgi:arylsulfatase A-like enzyme